MDYLKSENKGHRLAQEIKDKNHTLSAEGISDLAHMRFHPYVIPPENYDALVYYNTIHGMK